MKLVAEHLGEIILAVAGVALLVGVILCFGDVIGNFFMEIVEKLTSVATDSAEGGIWGEYSYDPTGFGA